MTIRTRLLLFSLALALIASCGHASVALDEEQNPADGGLVDDAGLDVGTGSEGETGSGSSTVEVTELEPSQGPAGSVIRVHGRGFEAGDQVQLSGDSLTAQSLTILVLGASSIVVQIPSLSRATPAALSVRVRRGSVASTGLSFTLTSGAVFYVAVNGDDGNAGTLDSPFATVNHAAEGRRPGDVVYLRAGEYRQAVSLPVATAGTETLPITFAGYPGDAERPILSGPGNPDAVRAYGSYVVLDHLRVTNDGGTGQVLWIAGNGWAPQDAHHITISNCEIFGGPQQGIHVSGTSNLIYRNDIHDNGSPSHQAHDHGIYVETQGNVIRSNLVHDNCTYGIHLYRGESGTAGGNLVERNYVYRNGFGALSSAPDADSAGIIIAANQPGNAIRDNVSCANAKYGVLLIDSTSDNAIEGNVTCYNGGGGLYMKSAGSGNRLTGNISYNDDAFAFASVLGIASDLNHFFRSDGNLLFRWNGQGFASLASFQSASGEDLNSQISDPRFASVPADGFDPSAALGFDFCTTLNLSLCDPQLW